MEEPTENAIVDWRPIFHASNQVVLYNPASHALSIRPSVQRPCPYCKQPLPQDFEPDPEHILQPDPDSYSRAANYFQLLAISNETSSRPSTPPPIIDHDDDHADDDRHAGTFMKDTMAEGYFKAFFEEECKLGMGANGSVFLCQVRRVSSRQIHDYMSP